VKFQKIIILLVVSLGLLWFSEEFSPASLFEPQSTGWILWVSFAKDLLQPFAFYFFLCLGQKWLPTWRSRALIAFGLPTLLEFGQIFYRILVYQDQLIYMGSFDLLDILVYALGVALAVLVERKVFARLSFWQ
jgi:hypothetical protein